MHILGMQKRFVASVEHLQLGLPTYDAYVPPRETTERSSEAHNKVCMPRAALLVLIDHFAVPCS